MMDFRVGDKVRFISYDEALKVYKNKLDINFDVFIEYGNTVSKVIGVQKDTVDLKTGFRCKRQSIRKIDNCCIELDKNLFEI